MEDILSLDEAVMNEVCDVYRPPRRRLPPILLARLLRDLEDFLIEYPTDDHVTHVWSHEIFHQAAKRRYLGQRDKASSYHVILADYFLGLWATKPKPFHRNSKGKCWLTKAELFRKINLIYCSKQKNVCYIKIILLN